MKRLFFITLTSILLLSFKGDLPAYKIFNPKGETTSWADLLKDAEKADIVLFGELHDNPICHWMQYELAQHLVKNSGKKVVFGAEMFEADQQLLVDEYLDSTITARNFSDQARLWPNHRTDYAPLLQLAAEQKVPFIATNIPRRYAALVNRLGFEGLEKLSDEAKRYIAPLPVSYNPELPAYKAMLKMGGKEMSNSNLPKAQAIKDATMAHFIFSKRPAKGISLHFHGTYHSNNFEGIYYYLKERDPSLKILTIASVTQQNIEELEKSSIGLANYILCIPESMTRTH